jgi:hypothetical protein
MLWVVLQLSHHSMIETLPEMVREDLDTVEQPPLSRQVRARAGLEFRAFAGPEPSSFVVDVIRDDGGMVYVGAEGRLDDIPIPRASVQAVQGHTIVVGIDCGSLPTYEECEHGEWAPQSRGKGPQRRCVACGPSHWVGMACFGARARASTPLCAIKALLPLNVACPWGSGLGRAAETSTATLLISCNGLLVPQRTYASSSCCLELPCS